MVDTRAIDAVYGYNHAVSYVEVNRLTPRWMDGWMDGRTDFKETLSITLSVAC